jgi:hypothetical protein
MLIPTTKTAQGVMGANPDNSNGDGGRCGTAQQGAPDREREYASVLRLPPGLRPLGGKIHDWDGLHDLASEFSRRNDLELRWVDTGCTRAVYDHDYDDDGGGPLSTTTTQTSTTTPALTPTPYR